MAELKSKIVNIIILSERIDIETPEKTRTQVIPLVSRTVTWHVRAPLVESVADTTREPTRPHTVAADQQDNLHAENTNLIGIILFYILLQKIFFQCFLEWIKTFKVSKVER